MSAALMNERLHSNVNFTAEEGEAEQTDIEVASLVTSPLKPFVGTCGFLESVFWKLLAGIRGNLTDGFLRESSVIQQRCVSEEEASQEHMLRKRAQNKPSDVYGAVETLKTTEAQTHSFFYFSLSLTDKGQMVI